MTRAARGRFHGEARRGSYDAIVVGSGIGGLTTAALLARAGRSVLVVERHDRPGGYAHSFRRAGYLFDSAVHMVGGCERGDGPRPGLIHQLLETLEVRDRCDFERLDPCYAVHLPDFEFRVSSGLDRFASAYVEEFPAEKDGIHGFLAECERMRDETREAMGSAALESRDGPARFPSLRNYRRATVQDVLESHVSDERLRSLLTALWPYLGLPPSRLSFVYWAAMLMSYVADGSYYCRGTFQRLADSLADAVRASGGELLFNNSVRRIRVSGGCTQGIVLENGQKIDAPLVVSNADARQTVEELVGEVEFGERYLRSIEHLRPSVSALVGYLATDLDLSDRALAHESFVYESWDHDRSFATSMAGEPSWFSVTVPTRSDPSLAPPGTSLLVLTTLVPYEAVSSWRDQKRRYEEMLLVGVEKRFPGLRARLDFVEVGTPRTMERYTRNSAGAIYGWDLSPDQIGPSRPRQRTPIEGLFLAGHWTRPGGGIYGVVTSGIQAARSILGFGRDDELWESLRSS
jgi:phytoene desaturase